MLGKPALPPGQDGAHSQSKALLAQQGVAAIATAVGTDLVLLGQVSDQRVLGVTWPAVVQGGCSKTKKKGHKSTRVSTSRYKAYPISTVTQTDSKQCYLV